MLLESVCAHLLHGTVKVSSFNPSLRRHCLKGPVRRLLARHPSAWSRENHYPKWCTTMFMWSGWWFQPLWKIWVSWDDYSQYMEKWKMFQTTNQFIDTSFWHMMKTYLSPLLSLVDLSRFQISVLLDLGCTSNIVSDDENFCRGTSSGFRNWHMSCLDMILCWYNMFLQLEIWKMRTFHRSQASGKRKVNIITFCCGFRTRIFIIEIYLFPDMHIFPIHIHPAEF